MMPTSVPNFTNWVILRNKSLYNIDGFRRYLLKVKFLHLGENILNSINDSFLFHFQNNISLTWLNLTRNKLTRLPSKMQELNNLEKIWLSGNPFHCDCSMLWMIGWLNNFITPRGYHVVVDYQDVRCHSGAAVRIPIYKLNDVILGCYLKGLTIWQKVGIGAGSGSSGLIIIVLVVFIIKRSRTMQFFIFYKSK